MFTWIRRLVGLALAAMAIRWIVEIILDPPAPSELGYPNEWGVRTTPLTPAERAVAEAAAAGA